MKEREGERKTDGERLYITESAWTAVIESACHGASQPSREGQRETEARRLSAPRMAHPGRPRYAMLVVVWELHGLCT